MNSGAKETARFPEENWEVAPAREVGFEESKLAAVGRRLAEEAGGEGRYRVCVVRGGCIAVEWQAGVAPEARIGIASAQKSVYSCLLGIAIAEGKIPSAEAPVSDYYPEMLDVPEGAGPKAGRSNRPEDAQITFRHLITNTSGYLKPDERPGEFFHYQTWGMNILMHAVGKVYGVYNSSDPEGAIGPGELIREKIRNRIGGTWTWEWGNFGLSAEARIGIFGYHTSLQMTARDACRLGWLWRNLGRWKGSQVVPEEWLQEATVSARAARRDSPTSIPGVGMYGHGFWTNDQGKLWPELPRDSFAAAGAGSQLIWVSPSLDLVIAQSPGLPTQHAHLDGRVVQWIAGCLKSR